MLNLRTLQVIEYILHKENLISMTKLLKYLYIIDKRAVNNLGYDLTDGQYFVWKMGPVYKEVYQVLKDQKTITDKFEIKRKGAKTRLSLNGTISNLGNLKKEFSINELNLLDSVLTEYSACDAKDMISELHEPDTLWYKIAEKYNLLDAFSKTDLKTTSYEINLEELIKDNNKLAHYREIKDNLQLI
jgi:uncharacterized phage-associated protein